MAMKSMFAVPHDSNHFSAPSLKGCGMMGKPSVYFRNVTDVVTCGTFCSVCGRRDGEWNNPPGISNNQTCSPSNERSIRWFYILWIWWFCGYFLVCSAHEWNMLDTISICIYIWYCIIRVFTFFTILKAQCATYIMYWLWNKKKSYVCF